MWGKVRNKHLTTSIIHLNRPPGEQPTWQDPTHLRPEVLHTSAADVPHTHLGQVDWATLQCHQPRRNKGLIKKEYEPTIISYTPQN